MFIESEIVIGTMVELMRSYRAPCFSVHDSIIVRKKDQKIAVDTLENQFLGRTSVDCLLLNKSKSLMRNWLLRITPYCFEFSSQNGHYNKHQSAHSYQKFFHRSLRCDSMSYNSEFANTLRNQKAGIHELQGNVSYYYLNQWPSRAGAQKRSKRHEEIASIDFDVHRFNCNRIYFPPFQ